jgi:chlorosome envelope protein F
MANESANNGVFSDLFAAVGDLAQQATDIVSSGVKTVTETVTPIGNASVQLCTTAINSAAQIIQGVSDGITAAIAPKK